MATLVALFLVVGAFYFLTVFRKKRWRTWYGRKGLVGILSPKKSFKDTVGEFRHPGDKKKNSRDVLRGL